MHATLSFRPQTTNAQTTLFRPSMPQSARQAARKIKGSIGKANQPKPSLLSPEAFLCVLLLVWLVGCAQLYGGMDRPSQQPEAPTAARAPDAPPEPRDGGGGGHAPHEDRDGRGPQPQEAALPGKTAPHNDHFHHGDDFPEHYMAFSTACSPAQSWQSFLFFYYAHKVQQPGHVVRIASACSDRQRAELTALHESVISKLSPKFSIHFTPDFARISESSIDLRR